MKQSLAQKQSQSLTMTPNMQQAIKLLQLPSQDLVVEIQNQLDSNIMLEIDDENSNEENTTNLDISDFPGEDHSQEESKSKDDTESNELESNITEEQVSLTSSEEYSLEEPESFEQSVPSEWDKVDVSSKVSRLNGDNLFDVNEHEHLAQNLSLHDSLIEQLELL